MRECNLTKKSINIFLLIYFTIVILLLYTTPFSYSEADILFSNRLDIDSFLVQNIYKFTDSVWALRLPFFIIALFALYLYKQILTDYFKKDEYYYNLSVLVFIITPGIFLSFILVNHATIAIFLTLLFIYGYKKESLILEFISLVLLLSTHTAYIVVFYAIAIYSFLEKKYWLTAFSFILIVFATLNESYGVEGIPKGHLLQLIGIYAAIFSPLLFLAIVFALYKIAADGKQDIIWYISGVSFLVSLVLAIRQKIKVTDFSPYLTIAIPLVIYIFKKSAQIRLYEFRGIYYKICKIVIIVLLLETLTIVFHYPLYLLSPDSKWLFDRTIYKIAKDANSSKNRCYKVISNKEKNLLRYYGIKKCN